MFLQKVIRNLELVKFIRSRNLKWKLEIVNGSRNLKVLAENEIQQKLKMFALKSFWENKLMLACEVDTGKVIGHVACSSWYKKRGLTAVWRNSWFCLSWKILWIFQFSFSKIFFLNCRWFAKRRNVITQFSPIILRKESAEKSLEI